MKIRIEHCSLGTTRIEWGMCYRWQSLPLAHHYESVPTIGLSIADARNFALTEAIRDELDILFFYDDDVMPRGSNGVQMLIESLIKNPGVTAISGVYPMKSALPAPVVFKEPGGGYWDGWKDGKLHKIFAAATGFMAISIPTLLTDAEMPEQYELEGKELGHQLYRFVTCHSEQTDEFVLGTWFEANEKTWLVHGGVVCNQVDRDGRVYQVEDYDRIVTDWSEHGDREPSVQ
ncbi:hypothetical protein LCGC14_0588020 [marine sediment metagenome]|uniref:Glycosyltransferase 2-like domain-containing protein n=1 Tax=marine sediment metagenome TaxID=412755 RepID=A0A0F9RJI7_9ZZZZ